MKQVLEYYYSLNIESINCINDNYEFFYNGYKYIFAFSTRDEKEINDIVLCQQELINKGLKTNIIMPNIFGQFLTKVDDNNYILMKVSKTEILNLEQIIDIQNKTILVNNKYHNNWGKLWSSKIDYIENQQNIIASNPIIHLSVDYFIGLTENAISIVNNYNNGESVFTLSHKRIKYPCNSEEYNNPLTYIFDLKVRDIAEYIKSEFFYSTNEALADLKEYLQISKLTAYEATMLYARLLYPSYYFDAYEGIINKKKDIKILLNIIHKIPEYESFLKNAYYEINSYIKIENISWLIQEH